MEHLKYANFIFLKHSGKILFQEITKNIKKNIWGAVFSFQYTMTVFKSYKERKWELHVFCQYNFLGFSSRRKIGNSKQNKRRNLSVSAHSTVRRSCLYSKVNLLIIDTKSIKSLIIDQKPINNIILTIFYCFFKILQWYWSFLLFSAWNILYHRQIRRIQTRHSIDKINKKNENDKIQFF